MGDFREPTNPALRAMPYTGPDRRRIQPARWWRTWGARAGALVAILTASDVVWAFIRPSVIARTGFADAAMVQESLDKIDGRLTRLEAMDSKLDLLIQLSKGSAHGRR